MGSHEHVIVYADGGSRGNPGVAGSGAVVYAADGRTVLRDIVYVVGKKATNNVAEYHGMLRGLEAARDLGARTVEVYMDSKLVVEQMSGRWKIKHTDLQQLAKEARRLLDTFDTAALQSAIAGFAVMMPQTTSLSSWAMELPYIAGIRVKASRSSLISTCRVMATTRP